MIKDYNIQSYVLFEEETIATALNHVVANRGAIICVVDSHNHLTGLFTNGDFLRWVVQQNKIDINQPVALIANRKFISAHIDDSADKILALLEQVNYVPLVDNNRHLVAVAKPRSKDIKIGNFRIAENAPTFIIAEIGLNHNGSLEQAKALVDAAVASGADCAKFQMRDLQSLYVNAGNPNDARENLGSQYTLDLLSRFELLPEEMFEVFDYCKSQGILPLCTPWDLKSLAHLESYGMLAYKVASADMTNHELLQALARTGKPVICSTGMSNENEILDSVRLMQRLGMQYILLQCNSTYPAPFKDINLRYLMRLAEIGECHVGYSGHERGYYVPIAAVAQGARVIEKHFTFNRNMEGNDHKVSLLPDEFKQMVEGIRQVEEAMGTAAARQITQGERMNRVNLAKSIIVNRNIQKGEVIERQMLEFKSPGRGLQPNYLFQLLGRKTKRAMEAGDFFYPSDLDDDIATARHYKFQRPWGIPVRYYDYKSLMKDTNPDFLEFHLSYKDMDQDFHQFFEKRLDMGLVVHSPDLFRGDHLLNLATEDYDHRHRSIEELQRVVDLTRGLKQYFTKAERPLIVASLGGFTQNEFIGLAKRQEMYALVADSLKQIDMEGVEIIGQTLPPFPWYFGGQLYLNLFVDPDDTAQFCETYGYRLCFDLSHSKLACNHFGWSFKEFIDRISPFIAHLHVVDAQGVDSEGLQIGEGDIDFPSIAEQLRQCAPDASFIPEIWQGHENNGEGSWIALNRLEGLF